MDRKDRRKQVSDESYPSASEAQLDECRTFTPCGAGSNPAGGTELEVVSLEVSEEEKMYSQWLGMNYEEVRRRIYTDLRVPKRFFNE